MKNNIKKYWTFFLCAWYLVRNFFLEETNLFNEMVMTVLGC